MQNTESELSVGKKYHIRNGHAKTLDTLWMNGATLSAIDQNWDLIELVFILESGEEYVIDHAFMQPFDKQKENQRIYMLIEETTKSTTNNEYHKNGTLAYTENIVKLAPDADLKKYPNHRVHPEGWRWIRVGANRKFYDNGQLAWEMLHDEFGNVTKEGDPNQYRKDGTIIQY